MHGYGARGLLLLSLTWGCGASSDDGPSESSTTMAAPASTSSSSTDADTSSETGAMTTTTVTTAAPTTAAAESSSSGEPLPEGPTCSVQVVTHGELFDPLPKGESAGLFPTSVGEALEDYCGCHTLMSNGQNIEHEFLKAPGGTLFLEYADIGRPFGSGTLGEALAEEVYGYAMPPGSCAFPEQPDAVLRKWFDEDMPDGSNFTPP